MGGKGGGGRRTLLFIGLVHKAPGNGWDLEEGRLGPGRSRGPAGPRPGDVTRFAVTLHRFRPSEPRRRGPGAASQSRRGRYSPNRSLHGLQLRLHPWHGGAAYSGRLRRRRAQARRHFAESWDGGRCSPGACAHRDAATRGSQPVLGSGLGQWLFAVKPPSVTMPCLCRVRGG